MRVGAGDIPGLTESKGKNMKKSVLGCGLAAFGLICVATGRADAFNQERYGSFSEADGNSNVYAYFNMDSGMQNANGTLGITTPTGFTIVPYLTSNSQQDIDTSVKIFGRSAKPFTALLSSEAYWQVDADDNDVYKAHTHGVVTLLGSTLYSSKGSSCGTGMRCLSATKSYEKEFARETAVFVLWGVPISVSGAISGSVGATMNADSTATPLNGERWTLSGVSNASWGPIARLTASFDTCLGVCGALAVGVTGSFNVLQVAFTPSTQAAQNTRLKGDARYSWVNRASLDLTTMNGEAALFADFLGIRKKATFVNWDGYSDSWKLYGFSGSSSCTGYRDRAASDCVNIARN